MLLLFIPSSPPGDASIINVRVPIVLVTNDTFYIQWNYPSLLINPLIDETNEVGVKHILITVKTNKAANDMVFTTQYSPETTSRTITGIGPDTRLTIAINIFYNNPDLLEGNQIEIERQTLPESESTECMAFSVHVHVCTQCPIMRYM